MAKRLKHKGFNFYKAARPNLERGDLRRITLAVIPVALCVIVLATFGIQQIFLSRGRGELQTLNTYLHDSERQTYYKEAQAVEQQRQLFKSEQKKLNSAQDFLAELPALSSDELTLIFSAASGSASIREMNYMEKSGEMTILAASKTVEDASQFAQNLRGTGLFTEVSYKGYQVDGGAEYEFTVSGVLKGGMTGDARADGAEE